MGSATPPSGPGAQLRTRSAAEGSLSHLGRIPEGYQIPIAYAPVGRLSCSALLGGMLFAIGLQQLRLALRRARIAAARVRNRTQEADANTRYTGVSRASAATKPRTTAELSEDDVNDSGPIDSDRPRRHRLGMPRTLRPHRKAERFAKRGIVAISGSLGNALRACPPRGTSHAA